MVQTGPSFAMVSVPARACRPVYVENGRRGRVLRFCLRIQHPLLALVYSKAPLSQGARATSWRMASLSSAPWFALRHRRRYLGKHSLRFHGELPHGPHHRRGLHPSCPVALRARDARGPTRTGHFRRIVADPRPRQRQEPDRGAARGGRQLDRSRSSPLRADPWAAPPCRARTRRSPRTSSRSWMR